MYNRDLETSAKDMAEHNTKMKQMAADRAKRLAGHANQIHASAVKTDFGLAVAHCATGITLNPNTMPFHL